MTGTNVLSYEVGNDHVSKLVKDFSSFLSVFNTLQPISFKNCQHSFYVHWFCCFLYTWCRVSLSTGSISFLVKIKKLIILFSLVFVCHCLDSLFELF